MMICFALVSLTTLCSASWFIVHQHASDNSGTHSAPSTCNCPFANDASFDGIFDNKEHIPTLTTAQQAIYGDLENFSIEWFKVDFKTPVGGANSNTTGTVASVEVASATVSAKGFAGTHHYKITDNVTGQVICEDHKVTIDKAPVVLGTPSAVKSIGFVGDTLKWSVAVNGDGTGQSLGSFNYTYKVQLADYGTSGKTQISTAHSGAVDAVASTKPLNNIAASSWYSLPNNYYNNNYYLPDSLTFSVSGTVLPTTYTTENTATYYGTITAAIKGTSSGTIYPMYTMTYGTATYTVIAGASASTDAFSHTITEDCTIANGVKLVVPNGLSETVSDNYTNGKLATSYGTAKYEINTVTVGATVELTNAGTITLPATISGGNGGWKINSVVSGNYSRIALGSNAKLINSGTINCYGFIDETSQNNGSQVIMNSGTLTTIFTVIEHRGGDVYMGLANPTQDGLMSGLNTNSSSNNVYSPTMTTFPFNRFYVQSVGAKLIVYNSALIVGHVVLWANSQANQTNINLIGGIEGSLIQLATGSRAECKYTHSTNETNKKHTIEIYGSITLNPIEMLLTVEKSVAGINATIKVAMNSGSTYFPLSHHFDIYLKCPTDNEGVITGTSTVDLSNQSIKLLPGASVAIDPNVTVNADKIAVYSTNELLNPSGYVAQGIAYPNCDPGKLIINGTLNVKSLGGPVSTENASAKLTISEYNYTDSYEIVDSESTTLTITVLGQAMSQKFRASKYSSLASSRSLTQTAVLSAVNTSVTSAPNVGRTYSVTQISSGLAWYTTKATITFDSSGGNNPPSPIEVDVTPNGMTTSLETINANIPTHGVSGVNFEYWCLDADLISKLTSQTQIVTNTTLYAKWDKEAYTITFETNSPTNADGSKVYADLQFASRKVIEGAYIPTYTSSIHGTGADADADTNIDKKYYFLGWSTSQTATSPDTNINISANTTLFAVWGTKHLIETTYSDTYLKSPSTITITVEDAVTSTTTSYNARDEKQIWVKPTDTVTVYVLAQGTYTKNGLFDWHYYGSNVQITGALTVNQNYNKGGTAGMGGTYGKENKVDQTLSKELMLSTAKTTISVVGVDIG